MRWIKIIKWHLTENQFSLTGKLASKIVIISLLLVSFHIRYLVDNSHLNEYFWPLVKVIIIPPSKSSRFFFMSSFSFKLKMCQENMHWRKVIYCYWNTDKRLYWRTLKPADEIKLGKSFIFFFLSMKDSSTLHIGFVNTEVRYFNFMNMGAL